MSAVVYHHLLVSHVSLVLDAGNLRNNAYIESLSEDGDSVPEVYVSPSAGPISTLNTIEHVGIVLAVVYSPKYREGINYGR